MTGYDDLREESEFFNQQESQRPCDEHNLNMLFDVDCAPETLLDGVSEARLAVSYPTVQHHYSASVATNATDDGGHCPEH